MTPVKINKAPMRMRTVIRSRSLRNRALSISVKRGFVAVIGETSTTCPDVRAKNSVVNPMVTAIPNSP